MELYDIEKLAKNNREMVKSLFKQKRIKYIKIPRTRIFYNINFIYVDAVRLINDKLAYYYTENRWRYVMYESDMYKLLSDENRILCKAFNELNKLK